MFNCINYMLFEKRRDIDNDLLSEFSPFMVSRYLTMKSPDLTLYVNDTLNRYGNIFGIREDQFHFYENIIPISRKKKMNYIKKDKEPKDDGFISAIPEFYSKRELDMLVNDM